MFLFIVKAWWQHYLNFIYVQQQTFNINIERNKYMITLQKTKHKQRLTQNINVQYQQMNQNQEGDPYDQYQQILSKAQQNEAPQFQYSRRDAFKQNNDLYSLRDDLVLHNYIPIPQPKKEPISVISGNHIGRRSDETVRRSPPNQFLSPQYSRNEQTRNDIKMKILLQNNRLKASIETLKKDICDHQVNEGKIAHIIKESKQKLSHYKFTIKEKSKRISEITENNMQLKTIIGEFQDKVNQLTAYSNWQQGQIRDLKDLLNQKCHEIQQQKTLHIKIERLQAILKGYEQELLKNQSKLSSEKSKISLQGEAFSSQSLNYIPTERWGTNNQLNIEEIQKLKHIQVPSNEEEHQQLHYINSNLKMKIIQLQKELINIKTDREIQKNEWQARADQNLKKSDDLKDQIDRFNQKSTNLGEILKQKQLQVRNLYNQLKDTKISYNKRIEAYQFSQKQLKLDIQQLNSIIGKKEQEIFQLSQKFNEKQYQFKKQQSQYEILIQQKEEQYVKTLKDLKEKLNEMNTKNNSLQKANELYIQKFEQYESYRDDNQERLRQANNIIDQKEHLLSIIDQLNQQIQQQKRDASQQYKNYQQKLQQFQHQIKLLQEQKITYNNQMDNYASQINDLKIAIKKMNFPDSFQATNSQRILEEQQQESETSSYDQGTQILKEGSLQNGNKVGTESKITTQKSLLTQPLKEQEQLQYEQSSCSQIANPKILREKQKQIQALKNQIEQLKENFKQKLDEQRNQHNISMVQFKFKEQQQKDNLQRINKQMSEQLKALLNDNMQRKLQLQLKVDEIQKLKNLFSRKQGEYQQKFNELSMEMNEQAEEIQYKQSTIIQLQMELQHLKCQELSMSNTISKLQVQNKKHISAKVILQNRQVELQHSIKQLKEQNKELSSSKEIFLAQSVEQLKNSLEIQVEQKILKENKLYFSQQFAEKQKKLQQKHQQAIKSISQRNQELLSALKIEQTDKKNLQLKNSQQLTEIKQLENQLKQFQTKINQLQQLLHQKDQFHKFTLQKLDQYKHQIQNNIQQQLSKQQTKEENQLLKSQVQQLKMQNSQLTLKIIETNQALHNMKTTQNRLKSYISQKDTNFQNLINTHNTQIQSYQMEKERLTSLNNQSQKNMVLLAQKIEQLQNENQNLKREVLQIKEQNKNINYKHEELKLQVNKLTKDQISLNDQLKQLKSIKQILQTKINESRGECDNLKITLTEKQNKIQELDTNLVFMRSSLQLSKTQNSQKLNILRQSFIKQKQLSLSIKLEEVEQSKTEIQRNLKDEIQELTNQNQILSKQYLKCKTQNEKIKEDLSIANQQNNISISSLENFKISLTELIKEKQLILQRNEKEKQELKITLQQNINKQKQINDKLTSLQEQLSIKQKQLTTKTLQFQKQKQSLKEEATIVRNMMHEMQDENELKINKLLKQISNLKVALDDVQKDANHKLQQSDRSINQIQSQFNLQSELIQQMEIHLKSTKQAMSTLKQQLQRQKINSSKLQKQNIAVKSQNQQKELKIKTIQSSIDQKDIKINEIQLKFNTLKQQKQTLQSEKCSLMSRLSDEKTNFQQLKSKNQNEKKQNNKNNQQLAALRLEVTNLKSKILILQQKFSTQILQKSKLQECYQQTQNKLDELLEQKSNTIKENQQLQQLKNKFNSQIAKLQQQKYNLNIILTNLQKQHSMRIENLRLQLRDHSLQLQRKYNKQVQQFCEQLSKIRNQKQTLLKQSQKIKKIQKQYREDIQRLKIKIKQFEMQQKQLENQRGQLTDKILQITQQNNQFNEVIQNLRNDAISKSNQLFQCKQILEKLHQENQMLKQNKESPQINRQNSILSQDGRIDQLQAIIQQLQNKNQLLRNQINERIKNQRQLQQKIEQMKVRQNRERNSSVDSLVTRSKIFNDEKSQTLQAELQQYKLKIQSDRAYIIQLEDECQKYNKQQNPNYVQQLQNKIKSLQTEKESLKNEIQYKEAYIEVLQSEDIKASLMSKRSAKSRKTQNKKFLSVDQDHSVVSMEQSYRSSGKPQQNEKMKDKISMLNSFIENYKKDKDSMLKEDQFRKNLNNSNLQELLSTIIYKLQKEVNNFRQKDHYLQQLQIENQQLQQQSKNNKQTIDLLTKKFQIYENLQKKYNETKAMLQESLMSKLKYEATIAQYKRNFQQMQDRYSSGEKNKDDKLLIGSHRRDKETLSVLHEQSQDGSSDSMMPQDLESQMPSSLHQSKQILTSIEGRINGMNRSQTLAKKFLSRTSSLNLSQKSVYLQFLNQLLDHIDEIQSQLAYIQIQLQEKGQHLASLLSKQNVNSNIAIKIHEIQRIVSQNDNDLRHHMEISQMKLIELIRTLLKVRQQQDQYGLQIDSRKKIQQYLKLLQGQLIKDSKYKEEQAQVVVHSKKRSQSPKKLKMSLQQISQDVVNQDKSSSVINSKNSQVIQSVSNSINESSENTQLKNVNAQLLKELHQSNGQLSSKQEIIRSMSHKFEIISKQIGVILDELLVNFQQNQYLLQQTNKVKLFLSKLSSEQTMEVNFSQNSEKRRQSQKMILIQSNKVEGKKENPKKINFLEQLIKITEDQFAEIGQQIGNQDLKLIQKRLSDFLQVRYEDCLQFLNNQQSLILDILKINQQKSEEEQTMQKLAARFTKQQITDIITNSHNKQQARKTLNKFLIEEGSKSQYSDEQDFSPNPQKIQQIRKRVYTYPTELSLALYNQLLKILAAPTRQNFYDLIEQFFQIAKRFEDQIREEVSEKDSRSEDHSIRMKKLLEDPVQNLDFEQLKKMDYLEIKPQKNRTNSCTLNIQDTSAN